MNIKLTIKRLPLIVCLPLYIWTTPSLAADLLSTYKLAEQFDTEIRAAKAEYSAEKQRVPQSRAALLPQVSGTISKGRLERETEREGLDFSDIPGGETDEDQLTYWLTYSKHFLTMVFGKD